jgi:hypothetical protein
MNRLPEAKRLAIVSALVEGNSIRSTERMTGVHRDTILRLLVSVGDACGRLLNQVLSLFEIGMGINMRTPISGVRVRWQRLNTKMNLG